MFKRCKKYFIHHQNSIFRGEITPSKIIRPKSEIKEIMNPNEDYVTIIKFVSDRVFSEQKLGITKDSESLLL